MVGMYPNIAKKPMNKWLIGFMLLTIILTAWTAFNDNATKADDLINEKSIQPRIFEDSIAIQGQINQQGIKKTASEPKESALNIKPDNWLQLKRKPVFATSYNLFKVHSWVVLPPVVKQKPQPLPPPVAPPVPFIYMGKFDDPTKGTQVFLTANGRLYSVFNGEKIDQQWRLDSEDAQSIQLTFLPLNLPQVLSKSAKPAAPVAPIEPAVIDANT